MNATEIRERAAELHQQSVAVSNKAEQENRLLTTEEQENIDGLLNEVESLIAQAERLERLEAQSKTLTASQGRKTTPAGEGARATHNSALDKMRWGFAHLGEFANSVRTAATSGRVDPRLLQNAALSTYSSEGIGADGGFAVPPEYRAAIQTLVLGEDSLLSRCDASPTNSSLVVVPTDEDTAWGTSGGVRVYRRGEAAAMTQSKVALKDHTTRVDPIYALVPVTDELLNNAPMLARFLTQKAGEKLNFKINDEIVNGTGSGGQCVGILNSQCLVTVLEETSQASDTLVAANLLNMFSRMPAMVRKNAVWLANQDIEPHLYAINIEFKSGAGAGIAAGVSGLMPEGGMRYDPSESTLLGRPIVFTEACQTLGDKGDIILAYLPGYFAPYEVGGVKEAMSMHLWFDQGVTAFRWSIRIGGQPWLSAPISRKNGNNTLSHFVCVETR